MTERYEFKPRPDGHLDDEALDHAGPVFDYITELHELLWRVTRAVHPGASGRMTQEFPRALEQLEKAAVETSPRWQATAWRAKAAALDAKNPEMAACIRADADRLEAEVAASRVEEQPVKCAACDGSGYVRPACRDERCEDLHEGDCPKCPTCRPGGTA